MKWIVVLEFCGVVVGPADAGERWPAGPPRGRSAASSIYEDFSRCFQSQTHRKRTDAKC